MGFILGAGLPRIRARSLVFLSSDPDVLPPLRPRGLDPIQQDLVAYNIISCQELEAASLT